MADTAGGTDTLSTFFGHALSDTAGGTDTLTRGVVLFARALFDVAGGTDVLVRGFAPAIPVPVGEIGWSADELLDLVPGIGQRQESYQFDVLNADRTFVFTLTMAETDNPPSVAWDSTNTTNRTLHGLTVGPDDAARINPFRHRLRVSYKLQDGTLWPLGLFLFASDAMDVESWGDDMAADLYDQSIILNQPRGASFSLGTGSQIVPAISQLVGEVGLTAYTSIDSTGATLSASAPGVWDLDKTRREILSDLCAAAGFYPPYFDNNGILRFRAVPNIAHADADLTFLADDSSRIVAGTTRLHNNLLNAPNRYIVRGAAAGSAEIIGIYDVPASAPQSAFNRGYVVVAPIIDNQTVSDSVAAQAAAQAAYSTDASSYDTVEFTTAADPRDDGFLLVDFLGTLYREQTWSLELSAGGTHTHTAAKVYQ